VGDGEGPGDDGAAEGVAPTGDGESEAAVPAADDEADGGTVLDDDAEGVPDCTAEGEVAAAWVCETAGDDAPGATLGDGVRALAEGLVLTWPPGGPSATGRGCAASTAAPSATSPRSATIGTKPTRLPRGRRSRQFGQKPDTGVVT
jgi:hypothetical protein